MSHPALRSSLRRTPRPIPDPSQDEAVTLKRGKVWSKKVGRLTAPLKSGITVEVDWPRFLEGK